MSRWARGVVAPGAFALALVAGCSGPVEIEGHDVDPETRAACASFLADLPETVGDQGEVEVTPDDALGRAWGDPAIVITCGVPEPKEFDEFSLCDEVNGVGWFVPDDAVAELNGAGSNAASAPTEAVVLTVITHEPQIRVEVPAEHRPPADVMVTVSDLVIEHGFRQARPACV